MCRHAFNAILLALLAMPTLALAGRAPGSEGPMLTVVMESHAGSMDKSLSGSTGFGAGVKMRRGRKPFKLNVGAIFTYTPATINLSGLPYDGTAYGGEVLLGFALIPVTTGMVAPIIEGNLLLGGKMLRMDVPPVGAEPLSVALTYGIQFSFGAQFSIAGMGFQASVDYTLRQGSALAGQTGFNLNSLVFELGWLF